MYTRKTRWVHKVGTCPVCLPCPCGGQRMPWGPSRPMDSWTSDLPTALFLSLSQALLNIQAAYTC